MKAGKQQLLLSCIAGVPLSLCVWHYAIATDEPASDFVKALQHNGTRDVSWSDYKSDGKGGEVFKDLVIKAPNTVFMAEESDLSNFKSDSSGKSGSADHILLKNVSITATRPLKSAGITAGKIQELDIPKLHYKGNTGDIKIVLKNAEFKAVSSGVIPALNSGDTSGSSKSRTYKITQAANDAVYDYAQNDFKADFSINVKDDTNIHINVIQGGLNKVVDMQQKVQEAGKQLDHQTMTMMLLADSEIKSLDIEAENLKANKGTAKKPSISYDEDYGLCRTRLQKKAMITSVDICTPLTRYKRDMEKSLKIRLHPDQPVQVMDLVIMGKAGGPEAVDQILKTLNFSVTN